MVAYLDRDQGLGYMNNFEARPTATASAHCRATQGLRSVVDPHGICGAKVKECTVEFAGEAHVAR